jgi:hypothetical protein
LYLRGWQRKGCEGLIGGVESLSLRSETHRVRIKARVSALVHGGGCEEVGRLLGFGMLGVEEGGEGLRLREQMTDRIGHLDGSSYSRQSRFHLIIGPELVAA